MNFFFHIYSYVINQLFTNDNTHKLFLYFKDLTKNVSFINEIVHVIIRKNHVTFYIKSCHHFYFKINVVMTHEQIMYQIMSKRLDLEW